MKAIILTGYSSGLGKAIRQLLLDARRGYKLIFIGRSRNRGNSVKACEVYRSLDFSQITYGDFDFLDEVLIEVDEVTFINNAASIEPISNLKDIDDKLMHSSMNVNYFTPVFLLSKLIKLCKDVKVLNISSGAAVKPIPYWGAYCASKSAIRAFFEVVKIEGVQVVHVDPGVMDTDMQKRIREKSNIYPELEEFKKLHGKGELRNPIEVANEICRLV